MEPQDIDGREFFVGLRGYDRDEVDRFLAEVAADQRAMRQELEQLRTRGTGDPFEELGASVTAVLRTANDSAAAITGEAEQHAERVRREADEEAARCRAAAEEQAERTREAAGEDALRIRADADAEAARVRAELADEAEASRVAAEEAKAESERLLEESRRHAEHIVERAHEEAGRILKDADARVPVIEAEAAEAGRERARAMVEEVVARLTDATRRHDDLRARLAETGDEVQLALLALGEPLGDPRQAIDDAVRQVIVLDDAGSQAETS